MSSISKPQKCNGLDDVPTIQIYYVNDNSTKFAQIKACSVQYLANSKLIYWCSVSKFEHYTQSLLYEVNLVKCFILLFARLFGTKYSRMNQVKSVEDSL